MTWRLLVLAALVSLSPVAPASAQAPVRVVDVPTRPGVTQRFLLLTPANPKAVVVLFAGGHGGLQLSPEGKFGWGAGNFLVRSRNHFADHDLMVVVVDAPSDRQSAPFLAGYRQKPEHVTDIKAVIAWLRQQANLPVWLVGTSLGTVSAAFIGTELGQTKGGPDGIVLTSSTMSVPGGRAVPQLPLHWIAVPVLVVHHKQDACPYCAYADVPRLMKGLTATPRKELITFEGGTTRGDPCEAFAYHGYNGLEREVVAKIAEWITTR